jgi:sulfonate transport system ATP-binding protein
MVKNAEIGLADRAVVIGAGRIALNLDVPVTRPAGTVRRNLPISRAIREHLFSRGLSAAPAAISNH